MGQKITVIAVPDEKFEGISIVNEIDALMGGTNHYNLMKRRVTSSLSNQSYGFSDFAVLFRTNSQAYAIEEAFIKSGIPYRVIGRESSHVKGKIREAILSIGGFENIQGDGIDYIIDYIKPFIENTFITGYKKERILEIINELNMLSPADDYDKKADAVSLMTIHMAKGLEFKVVFLTGVEEGILPYSLNHKDVDIEEERRLFYVAMTRAAEKLYLIYSKERYIYGKRRCLSQSRFLSEIPVEFIERINLLDKTKRTCKKHQTGLF